MFWDLDLDRSLGEVYLFKRIKFKFESVFKGMFKRGKVIDINFDRGVYVARSSRGRGLLFRTLSVRYSGTGQSRVCSGKQRVAKA